VYREVYIWVIASLGEKRGLNPGYASLKGVKREV